MGPMLKTLDEITKRVVESYRPESIILYGSHARGMPRQDSDIDLLIFKEINERPLDRRIRVERLLSKRLIPLISQFTHSRNLSVFFLLVFHL